jgi:ABC-type oligopeptide transport system substrate-binding subunit
MSEQPAHKLDPNSLGYQRIRMLEERLSRRGFIGLTAGAAAAALLAACGAAPTATVPAPTAAAKPTTATSSSSASSSAAASSATTSAAAATSAATTSAASSGAASSGAASSSTTSAAATSAAAAPAALPADAAAADQQIYVVHTGLEAKVLDFYESVYARPGIADLWSEPLVRLSKDNEIVPGAALSWSGSQDGKTWTFNLDKALMWSDGNPVTADDYIATFQYGADPKHAWDFTWYFQGVMVGWDDAIGGKIPLDQLGVKKTDDHTLIIQTQVPAPYLPAMLLYSWPLSKAALAKSGPLYNTKPETMVSAGPFMLKEWTKDQQLVYVRNPKYTGKLTPAITQIVQKVADAKTDFTSYQNNEIDFAADPAPAELKIIQADPDLSKQVYPSLQDYRTYYLFFDVTKPPFDNLKVRQAFSHAFDRDTIQKQILGPGGITAYSWLAPGFPASNRDGLKDIQAYDVAKAKQLLSDAGFPDGKGFPKQTLWLRNENALNQAVANAMQSMLKQNLGIDSDVSNKDTKLFMDSLTAKPTQILYGFVSYGMDFIDPFNMLGVWLSGGRHSWVNKDFDDKVKSAASFIGDPAQRIKMFQDAERILVTDCPGIFIYHKTQIQLFKPYVKGDALTPDKSGNASMHWPDYTTASTVPNGLYMTKDVSKRKV